MGQQKIDTNISSLKLKSMAVQTQFEREEINDRKQGIKSCSVYIFPPINFYIVSSFLTYFYSNTQW